ILPSDNHSARFDYFNLAEGCFQNVIFDSNITLNKEKSAVFLNFLEGQLPTDVGYKFGLIDDILKYLSMHIPNFKPIKSYEIVRELHR
nr:hypothetical protein [Saprospiraceae bacterium]